MTTLSDMINAKQIDSIALVDVSYTFAKRYHTIGNATPMAAAKAALLDIERLKLGVKHVIICRDAPPYYRKEVFADYKSKRPVPEPEEKAQRRHLYEELQRLGFNMAWSQGYEADDIIATLATAYGPLCGDVRIVGPDKDMAQLITPSVTQWIPPVGVDGEWEVRGRAEVINKFGVAPERMIMFQALCGDSTDNIPGVKGIGKVKAADLTNKYGTIAMLATALANKELQPAVTKSLAENWEKGLQLSLKLVTLDRSAPVDAEALLIKHAAEPSPRTHNDMTVELPGYIGNQPPEPDPDLNNNTELNPLPEENTMFQEAKKIYEAKFVTTANDTKAARSEEEDHYEEERRQNREPTDVSFTPPPKSAERPKPQVVKAAPTTTALAVAPAVTSHSKYGLVTADLQPLDLTAAYTVSEWLCTGGLYPQFKTPAQIFSIIARGKELGIGMTTALAGHHMVEGKPTASADLIRALAERDKDFDYLMPLEFSSTKVVWIGKNKRHPKPVEFAYTIDDARAAGLIKTGFGKGANNWEKRPQDMLMKTAGSKLARLLWPGATLGLYCPEEFGITEEQLQEAA